MTNDESYNAGQPLIELEKPLDPIEGQTITTKITEKQNSLEELGTRIVKLIEDIPEEERGSSFKGDRLA